jgi:hypothetical protein
MDFTGFPKIPRLSRDIVITEKIDGTNAQVYIGPTADIDPGLVLAVRDGDLAIIAGSRTRWITPGKQDNAGFAGWVRDNAHELFRLGPGRHFGEWWGRGIQRGYGLAEKRFSLFNVAVWGDDAVRPACCSTVPVLYQGPFTTEAASTQIERLRTLGSVAAPGFMNPEGIIVFHTAGNLMFKKTVEGDEHYKGARQQE